MDAKEITNRRSESPKPRQFDLIKQKSQESLRTPTAAMEIEKLTQESKRRMEELKQQGEDTNEHLQFIKSSLRKVEERPEIYPELQQIQKEMGRLLQKQEQRKEEYQGIPQKTALLAQELEKSSGVTHPNTSETSEGVKNSHIQEKQTHVHELKEQLYEEIKKQEILAIVERIMPESPERELVQGRQNLARTRIQDRSTGLATAQKDLEELESKVPPESRQQALQESDIQASLSAHVWDAQINLYKMRRGIEVAASRRYILEQFRRRERDEQESQKRQLEIKPSDMAYDRYTKVSIQRGNLFARRRALASDLTNYKEERKKLEVLKQNVLQSFHGAQAKFANTSDQSNLQGMKEELGQRHKEAYDLLHETSTHYQEKISEMEEEYAIIETREIPKINHRYDILTRDLGDVVNFFKEKGEYDSEKDGRKSLSSDIRNGCVPSCMLTIMNDILPERQISIKDVSEAVKLRDLVGGADLRNVPAAFRKLGSPEDYYCIDIANRDSSMVPLEKVLQGGPVIVHIQNKHQVNHAIVIDKIEQDEVSASQQKYVYIRDAAEGSDGKGESYRVSAKEFQDVWVAQKVVVPRKGVNMLEQREYAITGYPNEYPDMTPKAPTFFVPGMDVDMGD